MNKKMLMGAAAGVLAVLIFAKPASAHDGDDGDHEYEALFTVTDTADNSPVSGAVVSLDGASDITNGSGQATIGLEGPGTYTVTVTCSGYNTVSDSFTFDESLTVTAEV